MKELLATLVANDGLGDLNEFSVDVLTAALEAKYIKVVAAGPYKNIQITRRGRAAVLCNER